ncbi:MAG: hypothetical protein ACPGWR_17220 [Ardenticatenaceae bacterium]
MIAVKAMYQQGNIKFLDRPPLVEQTPVVVVFLDQNLQDPWLSGYGDLQESEPMDEEDAQLLMSTYQELMPYRIEAENAYLNREEP